MPEPETAFPAGFTWGVATAAYQIEGAVREDGRGESIWDRFSHTPGRTLNGDTGDVACDHYHRVAQDVELLSDLGIPAYRFSIAWPRIFPQGRGRPNERGLAFYDRLVDLLLARRITPVPTLYHWDLPQAVQDKGGWASRDTVGWFGDYAGAVYTRLADRVPLWITHNEPSVVAFVGHLDGVHAPGLRDLQTALDVAHHLLLSHAEAVAAYRAGGWGGHIGITLNLSPGYPASDTEADEDATRLSSQATNGWFLDPILRGSYPDELTRVLGGTTEPLRAVRAGDLAAIQRPIDFLGVNYYTRRVVRANTGGVLPFAEAGPRPGVPVTAMDWEIVPEAFFQLLASLEAEYDPPPIYITENGAAFADAMGADGRIQDRERIDYLAAHIDAVRRAIQAGVDVRGYFCWSFLDNFEWALGYSRRFGLVYVDYPTQPRIPKASAAFYSGICERNRA